MAFGLATIDGVHLHGIAIEIATLWRRAHLQNCLPTIALWVEYPNLKEPVTDLMCRRLNAGVAAKLFNANNTQLFTIMLSI